MQKIILHDGKAHFDETFALGILLSVEFGDVPVPEFPEVVRRDPIESELENPEVAVIDVGRRHEPAKNNFDHHHDESLPASFRLVAQNYSVEGQSLDLVLKDGTRWYEYKDLLDRKGPNKAAHSVGVHGDTKALQSPMEGWIIDQFRETNASKEIVAMIALMAKDWIDRALDVSARIEEFEEKGEVLAIGDLGVFVIDEEPDSFVIDQLRQKDSTGDFDVTISRNPRDEECWGVYRYSEVDLDFQGAAYNIFGEEVVNDDENSLFAHNNGFFAVVRGRGDARKLLKEAVYNSDTYSGVKAPSLPPSKSRREQ